MINETRDSTDPIKKNPIENILINAQIIAIFKWFLLNDKIDPNKAIMEKIKIIIEKINKE